MLTAGIAAVALTAACAGGKKAAVTTTTSTTELVTTTTGPPPPSRLTGRPQPDAAKRSRPALTVKVDNGGGARPQAGIDAADVVYEEVVEGGLVRFLVIFQSSDANPVGPIRSVRPVDPVVVTPIRGLFAFSGGIPQFVAAIRRAPVTLVGYDQLTGAYVKRRNPAPHNLYSSTAALYKGAKGTEPAPPALFSYVDAGQAFTGAAAAPVTHADGALVTTHFSWDYDVTGATWKRGTDGTPHTVESGAQLAFTNVILQFVPYRNTGSRDPAGNLVPEAGILGTGDAWVLSAGTIVKGRWSKPAASAVTEYTDATGAPIRLTPGATWVSLAPTGTQITVR